MDTNRMRIRNCQWRMRESQIANAPWEGPITRKETGGIQSKHRIEMDMRIIIRIKINR